MDKTSITQVLTHTREKLRFYEKKNKISQINLTDLEARILDLRTAVSNSKKTRDGIRDEKKELKVKQGFASNELLISDFEKRKKTIQCTIDRIDDLQDRHHVLSHQIASYPPVPLTHPSPSSPLKGGSGNLKLHLIILHEVNFYFCFDSKYFSATFFFQNFRTITFYFTIL